MLCGLASAAAAELAGAAPDRARALLEELARAPQARDDTDYPPRLPALVRIALAVGEPGLAARLAKALDPLYPLHEYALCTTRAALTEAGGQHAAAATLYAEAADRWRRFGNRVELAYALLGHGRCLVALGSAQAAEPLREAQELFAAFSFSSALAEADALRGQIEALRALDT